MNPEQEVLQSFAALLNQALPSGAAGSPDAWTIELVVEQGKPPKRPWALVQMIGVASTAGTEAQQIVTVPISCQFFVAARETRRETLDAAMELRDLLWRAVKYGVGQDVQRATPDRIPRWRFSPRVEVHRVSVTGTGGTFVLSIDATGGLVEVAPLPPTATAAQVAAAVRTAIAAATGSPVAAGDVVGFDRGNGLWDLHYGGALAGERIGTPAVDAANVTAPSGVAPAGEASVLLEGAPSPWRAPNDFIRVVPGSLGISRPLPDPDDPRQYSVALDLRCTFARGPVTASNYRVIQGITHGP